MPQDQIRGFVLSYFKEIQADVSEADGVFTVVFPPGRKRKFGGARRVVFDPAKSQPHVEVLEPGSPLLKLILLDAKQWSGVGIVHTSAQPVGTLLFTFRFDTFSSLKKRTKFVTAVLGPDSTTPLLSEGIPQLLVNGDVSDGAMLRGFERLQNAVPMVVPAVEAAARGFAEEAVRESNESFVKSLGRVAEYFQGLRQETFSDETRIRKRLGEIQSKLYFAEDGLRQLKLERERDRLTQELYQLKQKRTQSEDKLSTDQQEHVERQRRRHEPKLQVRLLAATLVQPPGPARDGPDDPEPEPVQVPLAATAAAPPPVASAAVS